MTLYSKDILRLSKESLSIETPSRITHSHRESNPICGDRVEWQLHIADQKIAEVWCETKGCALCKASSAVLYEGLIGSSTNQVYTRTVQFLQDVDALLAGEHATRDVALFSALPTAPARQECVLLPWKALLQAMKV